MAFFEKKARMCSNNNKKDFFVKQKKETKARLFRYNK